VRENSFGFANNRKTKTEIHMQIRTHTIEHIQSNIQRTIKLSISKKNQRSKHMKKTSNFNVPTQPSTFQKVVKPPNSKFRKKLKKMKNREKAKNA